MYMKLLIIRRSFSTNRDKLNILEFEQKTTEMKSVVGSIESTLQFTLMIWMMSRGILSLPWDQSLTSSCVEDSLGRIACLPSIPILSMFFSLLSIIKSVLDMNMVPFVNSTLNGVVKFKVCQHIVLCLFPFFLSNILFRLPAYAFILTFLDYWSIIPAVTLYILLLALYGIFFIKVEKSNINESFAMSNEVNRSTGTVNSLSENDDGKTEEMDGSPSGLVWNGYEWMSSSYVQGKTILQRQKSTEIESVEVEQKNSLEDDSRVTEINNIASLFNENNSPIFINSIAGFFFPCVYTTIECDGVQNISLKFYEKLLASLTKVIMAQVFLVNISIIFILMTILILITFVYTFNYKTNILNFRWFLVVETYLIIMAVITSVWSLKINPESFFSYINNKFDTTEEKSNKSMKEKNRKRQVTGDSTTGSVYSTTSSIIPVNDIETNISKKKIVFCFISTLIVLLPVILLVTVFKILPTNQIYIASIQNENDEIIANIIGSYASYNIELHDDSVIVNESVIVTNSSHADFNHTYAKIIIILDTRSEFEWRVSSPTIEDMEGLRVLKIRQVDFKQKNFDQNKKMILTRNPENILATIKDMGQCSNDPKIIVEETNEIKTNVKYLLSNGAVVQYFNLKLNCHQGGYPCKDLKKQDYGNNMLPFAVTCNNNLPLLGPFLPYFSGSILDSAKVKLINGKQSSVCCLNSSHSINFYGDQCETLKLNYLVNICKFSQYYYEGSCDHHGQKSAQFCKIFNKNCILKRSFTHKCLSNKPINLCQFDDFSCL